jgi:hypothetical protein
MVYFNVKNANFGTYTMEGIAMENFVVFLQFWYILWSFGIFMAILVYFPQSLLYQDKSGNLADFLVRF